MTEQPTEEAPMTMAERLLFQRYSAEDCKAAIRGERVPISLGLPLNRLCVIRGIRYHSNFGKELHGVLPEFTRALNARMIMSNIIPNLDNVPEAEIPYCICHPEVATEATYRTLAQKCPQMLYQVARACAVAGYTELYLELDVLPEVHVADEARECGKTTIFGQIVAAPVKYAVMNDYTRSIDTSNPQPASLDGNTAARWTLDVKQGFGRAVIIDEDSFDIFSQSVGFKEKYFNITEDMNIDEEDSAELDADPHIEDLLSQPLPVNLPTLDKDLLILMAAYEGNIDRYIRLRLPMMINKEIECCANKPVPIQKAIKARFIMNNVLAPAIFEEGPRHLPTLISVPALACESTYRALAKYKPAMVFPILRACIQGNYSDLFNELISSISKDNLEDGLKRWYIRKAPWSEVIKKRSEELGCTPGLEMAAFRNPGHTIDLSVVPELKLPSKCVPVTLSTQSVGTDWNSYHQGSLLNGLQCDVADVEILMCLPVEWRFPKGHDRHLEVDYDEWPPNWEELLRIEHLKVGN